MNKCIWLRINNGIWITIGLTAGVIDPVDLIVVGICILLFLFITISNDILNIGNVREIS